MSSITFAGPVPATRLRITARGRRVLAALVALPVAAVIAFAALSGGSALASGEQTTGNTFTTITVQPGDTLWSIAGEVAPNADPRDVVAKISQLNLVDGGVIEVGQHLAIPAEYGATGR
ncbi:MAG: LysM peptidoglycan-binding domain-containing protein [Microbacterium sp.]|jgi:LysM repeat protein|uniref:LysM peptidoglycan-binding domain-containing protein n=1 Tax=Microbacterium sp. TaxID=51671 RepID=UPI002837FD72|nr:LysM peptidoglycan-binding domain-containing protein [Microbacterium sp.]MDR2323202.1 LysM peptidoglycan-binding domain-containing protein [Microbacterium sp.]